MSFKKTVLVTSLGWLAVISSLHAWLNLGRFQGGATSEKTFKVGFLPVT